MCIIAIKPAGVKMPARETRENMWYGNPDGGGFMVATGHDVIIKKGFMKLSDFEDALSEEGDLTNKTVIMHYRITTHGGTNKQNCHPFPITNNVNIITKPIVRTDIGVAHNGIIHNVTPRKGVSDTMEYILSQISHMKKIDKFFYKKSAWLDLIEDAIDSKMVFLDKHGQFTTIGDFTEDEGVLYSNSSYKSHRFKGHYSTLGSAYGWDGWVDELESGYDWVKLMDLDEFSMAGFTEEYGFRLLDEDGAIIEPDLVSSYAIDKDHNVYEYEPTWDCWLPCPGHRAITKDGKPISYLADFATYCAVIE